MKNTRPIGIFDSGVGGLTVVKALIEKLPNENFVYFGDTANVPYGNKTKEQLMMYAENIINFFITKEVKAIIVACGTHSSVTLPELKQEYDIPILGVVKPGSKAAVKTTKNNRIGILATQATVNSKAYTHNIKEINSHSNVLEIACKSFVPLVEKGKLRDNETYEAVKKYLDPLVNKNIDTIVLGCTHYPFLEPAIKDYINDNIKLVDPADETINELIELFTAKDLLNKHNDPLAEFYVSGNDESFYNVGKLLMGDIIKDVKKIDFQEE
ncbi:glutamate racemase [Candidatus Syntrophocurvum alkaliphilum]|uniref:glutamate racemase n=1 Tax=Candidatus Syntrophocurvum alkaliphilum TaxID=2293317 RepID=UPI0012E2FA1D|nr:glutamate racemase [Candidatus Syntrophocurvum alkaliphilum]